MFKTKGSSPHWWIVKYAVAMMELNWFTSSSQPRRTLRGVLPSERLGERLDWILLLPELFSSLAWQAPIRLRRGWDKSILIMAWILSRVTSPTTTTTILWRPWWLSSGLQQCVQGVVTFTFIQNLPATMGSPQTFCQNVNFISYVFQKEFTEIFSTIYNVSIFQSNSNSNQFFSIHINVEAGLSLMKSTIAESGIGVTSRPHRTKHIEFWKHSMNGTRDRHPWYPRGVPWDQNFFFNFFFRQSNLGIYSYVYGLLRQK